MKLTDLEAKLVRWEDTYGVREGIAPAGGNFGDPSTYTSMVPVQTMQEAQGVIFLCPACFVTNGGHVGTHKVQVGFHGRGLLDHHASRGKDGKPTRWSATGDSLHNLSTTPSIDCTCWHGYVTNGEATPC